MWSTLASGDQANVSQLNFGAHTGTHVDAPAHFFEGAAGVESLPLDILIGPAKNHVNSTDHKTTAIRSGWQLAVQGKSRSSKALLAWR